MASDAYYHDDATAPRPTRWRGALLLILLAFAGGAVAMGYALTHWSVATRYLAPSPAPAPAAQRLVAPPPAPVASIDPMASASVDRRVADLEARLARIDARATAASGDADRAEGLLVAFAARRAIERGAPLGYLEALLRDRFAATQPQAVSILIESARQPVTLDELEAGLSAVAPALASADPGEDWWQATKRTLGGLVVIRRADTPSPAPADRLARAKLQLEAGHVAAALAEVARMPGRDRAAAWILQARRYATARNALDVIEAAALVDPRPQRAPATGSPSSPATAPPLE